MAAAPSSESDNCFKMNPVGPAKRYNSTRGQPCGQLLPKREGLHRGADGRQGPQPGSHGETNADVAAPRVADPIDGLGETEAVEGLLRGGDALLEGEVTVHDLALAM